MRLPGLIDTLWWASGFAMGVPMAIIGFELLARDRPVFGAAFLGLAIAVVFLPEYVRRQLPSPRAAVRRRLPWHRDQNE